MRSERTSEYSQSSPKDPDCAYEGKGGKGEQKCCAGGDKKGEGGECSVNMHRRETICSPGLVSFGCGCYVGWLRREVH